MSLINEALKRAEDDDSRRIPGDDSLPEMEPAGRWQPPRGGSFGVKILLALVLGTGAVSGWMLYKSTADGDIPKVAGAEPVPVSARHPAAAPTTPGPAEVDPAEAATVVDRTIDKIRYYGPLQVLTRTARQRAVSESDPATRLLGKPATTTSKPPNAPRTPPRPAIRRRIDPSRFKVTAIMSAPFGGTAIVNGALVGIGETVNGAKVIKITRKAVELELDGQRFTARM